MNKIKKKYDHKNKKKTSSLKEDKQYNMRLWQLTNVFPKKKLIGYIETKKTHLKNREVNWN